MSVGTDKITANILSDAQEKSDEILSKANIECETIVNNGNDQSKIEGQKILDAAEKQAGMKYQQIISEAKVNARRKELEAREELIEKSFKLASDNIEKQASENSTEYVASLKTMIEDASLQIGGGDLELLLRADDVANAESMIKEISKKVSDDTGIKTSFVVGEPVNIIGGVIVKTIKGDVEVKNTIEARMLRFKKQLRSEVAKKLFN